MLEFAGFHAVLCRTLLTQMSEFAARDSPSAKLPIISLPSVTRTAPFIRVAELAQALPELRHELT
jgi:hypothetical protein